MNQFWKDVGMAFTLGLIVPLVLLGVAVSLANIKPETQPTESIPGTAGAADEIAGVNSKAYISVLQKDDTVVQLLLNDYLTCVVLAEMPVSFEEEALKAQSVVARTYAIRAKNSSSKHDGAALCTDSGCCQAYIAEAEYIEKGGKEESIRRVREIINATDGQVLTYEGSLIEATYFSCSGGATEDAVAVWGTEVPYLQSVESPGEEQAAYYTDAAYFSPEELMSRLALELEGDPSQWFSNPIYTDGGGVATIEIGGKTFTGIQLRKTLDLRSTAFKVTADEDQIVFHTRGYGHRVGMSQYGANAMALNGNSYRQILAHYYQGTKLEMHNN